MHESSRKEAKGSKDFEIFQSQDFHGEEGCIDRYFTDYVPKAIKLADISYSFTVLY